MFIQTLTDKISLSKYVVALTLISVVSCTKPQTPNENLPSVDLGQQPGANTGTGGGTDSGTGGETGGGQTGNNPPVTNPPEETPAPVCTPEVGSVPAGSVVVNDGALMTNNMSVHLKLVFKESLKMKISNDDQCGCGTWEKFAESKAWTLTRANKQNVISVQYQNYEGALSECAKVQITHDNTAPSLSLILNSKNSYVQDDATGLTLSVTDAGTGLKSLVCTLNNVAYNCPLSNVVNGNMILSFVNSSLGSQTFSVTAKDQLDNSISRNISWTVQAKYQSISQDLEIKSNNKVDILIVDDNSPSMDYEQSNMAKRMSTFLNQLNGLNWRVALTTTDPTSQKWGDGLLLPMKGLNNQYYITSDMNADTAQKVLGNTIQRSEQGSPSEQGIFVTYRAIERSLDAKASPNKQFFRNDANLAVIVISDEDESATKPKNIPENLVDMVKSTWSWKKFVWHSLITVPGDKNCLNTNGYTYGSTYHKMSLLTGAGTVGGAIIGSVCEADYGSQLKGIANSVQDMQKIMQLQCAPLGTPGSNVNITLNGNNFTEVYENQGNKLVFKNALPAGQYKLQYKCQ